VNAVKTMQMKQAAAAIPISASVQSNAYVVTAAPTLIAAKTKKGYFAMNSPFLTTEALKLAYLKGAGSVAKQQDICESLLFSGYLLF